MIDQLRFLWQLLAISSVCVIAGILVLPELGQPVGMSHFLFTVLIVTFITWVTYMVMSRGIRKGENEGMIYMIGGIGLKFLLYLSYILVFRLVTKNLDKPFILIFFTLYLIFTIFLAVRLFKLLGSK